MQINSVVNIPIATDAYTEGKYAKKGIKPYKMPEEEIPSKLCTFRNPMTAPVSLDTVELRCALDKAVDDADLNVSERYALNKKFFPNGGGFELFPEDKYDYHINLNYNPKNPAVRDTFTRELESIRFPEHVSHHSVTVRKSSKSTYQMNLDNALKKLKKVLEGNI